MPIVSISMNDEMINQLGKLQKSLGFSGRSEIIRAGIRTFVQEEKQMHDLTGSKNAILTVVHADSHDNEVIMIKHDYEDLIRTHLHSKIDSDRCVEVFVLDGEGKRIESITNGFLVNKKMDVVKLVAL